MKGLRLLPDSGVVRETILKAVAKGRLAVCLEDGTAYCGGHRASGPEGGRRNIETELGTLLLDDRVLLAPAESAEAVEWMREDEEKKPGNGGGTDGGGLDYKPAKVTATTWTRAQEYAAERPLHSLTLTARTPADAAHLAQVAQPFGADAVSLDVTADGIAKQGGRLSFQASEISLNHPARPIETARTVYNSLVDGSSYEAVLTLAFGEAGRAGMSHNLKEAAEKAGEAIAPTALFGTALEGKEGGL